MTFLILQMFVYLLVALLLGAAAGWIWRSIGNNQEVETLSRQVNEAKAKIPQLESQVRARDDKLRKVQDAHASTKDEAAKALEFAADNDRELRQKEQEIARLKNQLSQLQSFASDTDSDDVLIDAQLQTETATAATPSGSERKVDTSQPAANEDADEVVAMLHAQIERLEVELADARYQLDIGASDANLRSEVDELTSRLRQKAQEHDRLNRQLEAEKNKVAELEQERELQNKSLQILHQQLEMERQHAGDGAAHRDSAERKDAVAAGAVERA